MSNLPKHIQKQSFKTGDIVVVTSGEYSSYEIKYVAKALRDFTIGEADDARPIKEGCKQKRVDLECWLSTGGYIEEIPHKEYWAWGTY